MNKKIYITIAVLSVVLVLVIILTYVLINAQNNESFKKNNNQDLSPTITPVDFTGVLEEQVPEEELTQVNQERALRRSLPFDGTTFIVSYDNYDDIFYVQLKEPVIKAQADFAVWRDANASALPGSRFQFIE